MQNKAFIGAPFSLWINTKTGELFKAKKAMVNSLISCLDNKGFLVDNSHLREDWGKAWMSPENCTPLDYKHIKDADLFIAIPGDPPSGGVHIELGWASALNKRIIILLEEGLNYSNLVLGLHKVAKVDYIYYKNINDCLDKLDKLMLGEK